MCPPATQSEYTEVVALSCRQHVAEPRMSAIRTTVSAIVTAGLIKDGDCETYASLAIVGPIPLVCIMYISGLLSSSITCLLPCIKEIFDFT